MPIQARKPAASAKTAARTQRSVSHVRLIQTPSEGHTGQYNDLIAKTEFVTWQNPDPYTVSLSTTLPPTGLQTIEPTYSFEQLASIVQRSNAVRQCIESMVVNIEGYGHVLEYVGPEGSEDLPRVQAEKALIEGFLSNCSDEFTLREIREKSRWDLEIMACRFFEISRDRAGRIVMFDHVPGITMRRTRREQEKVEVTIETTNPADPSQTVKRTASRNFCRFVQQSMGIGGWQSVYFKEFGDPRPIDPKTGYVNPSLPIEEQATEILMQNLYTPGSIYGLPRWFPQLPSILGSREAEMVNLAFFRENAIPAMAVLISGGALTAASFEAVEEYLVALRGTKSMNRILVLEAQSDDTKGDIDKGVGSTRIDMKPMASDRQQDALFKDYDNANQQKVRSSFRLPPIYAGRADDYTRATAFASMQIAEQQIFHPERASFDDIMNNKILRTYKPKYWKYKSAGIPVVDPEVMGDMVQKLDETGALTPNAVIKIANKVLGVEIEPVTEDWGDFPFQAVLQYINQGKNIEGLTEYLIDIEAEAEKAKEQMQMEHDMATELIKAKPVGNNPASNDKKIKPVNNNDSKAKKQDLFALKQMIRKELGIIAAELRDTVTAAVQVPARD